MPQFEMPIGNNPQPWRALNSFAQGYIEAMFFTDANSDCEDLSDASFDELAPAALASIIADCEAFEREAAPLLQLAYGATYDGSSQYGETQAGHDFWFTRNRHGVGFWSRGLPGTIGDDLSDVARKAGERAIYRGDDGAIYYWAG